MSLKYIKEVGGFKCTTKTLEKMCKAVDNNPPRVYDIIDYYGGEADSVTREAIFQYIADNYHAGNYDIAYMKWVSQ